MTRGTPRSLISELAELYDRLSPTARRALWALVALEVVLIAAAERDIQRRPADEIRGPKLLWRVVVTQNVIGPVAYFSLGKRRSR
jgi:hypothetical protein